MADRCVQTMEASLIKTMKEGEEVYLTLLTCKTTPLSHRLPSPSRIAEFLEVQNFITYLYSTNKTPRVLQTDHGPRKTDTATAVQ